MVGVGFIMSGHGYYNGQYDRSWLGWGRGEGFNTRGHGSGGSMKGRQYDRSLWWWW